MKTSLLVSDILLDKRFTRSALPSIDAVIQRLAYTNEPVNLIYGETYDRYGVTIDSLKYYLILGLIHRLLLQQDVRVTSTIVIGDIHSARNKLTRDKEGLLVGAAARRDAVRSICGVYGLPCQVQLMSELFQDEGFHERLVTMRPIFESSPELQAIAKQTVLANRLKQEVEAQFQYTLEEVALITGFDVKLGPPREIYYDRLAAELGPRTGKQDFFGIYLTPTYPLGLGFDYFVTHPEVEEYGLTPYKAGSNRLESQRIVLGATSLEQCERLVSASFISTNPALPNPALDLLLVAKLAGYFLQGDELAISETLMVDTQALKRAALDSLRMNIYEPLEQAL